jgi:hypothetical protein
VIGRRRRDQPVLRPTHREKANELRSHRSAPPLYLMVIGADGRPVAAVPVVDGDWNEAEKWAYLVARSRCGRP